MTVGTGLTLTGTVAPTNATNKAIVWSVKTAGTTGATISGSVLNTTAAGTVVVTATIANGATASTAYTQDYSITVNAPADGTEKQISINVGFNYGAIAITGSDGSNVIAANGSLTLSASGYTNVVWYVDGDTAGIADTGTGITLSASDYTVRIHSVTFTGRRNGNLYSQVIPFRVLE
jgi:hypothetical protein